MLQEKYYREIDSIRALAVVAVIVNHFNKDWFPGGFYGVDIFFVASGFVVTASLKGRENLAFMEFIKRFYSRRIKRLWPALAWMVLLFILPLLLFFSDSKIYVKTALYSLLGFSNIFLHSQSSNYFSVNAETNPFTHTWSLGVEEQFYLIFPILFFFGQRKRIFNRILLTLFFFSLGSFIYFYEKAPMTSFYMMPMRLWQFAIGALVYNTNTLILNKWFHRHLIILPFSVLIFSLFACDEFSFSFAFMISILTGLNLIMIKAGPERNYLTFKPILKIGIMSYSLYLVHWPVIVLFRHVLSLERIDLVLSISLIAFLSYLTHIMIETKWRNKSWRIPHYVFCLLIISFVIAIKNKTLFIRSIFHGTEKKIAYSLYGHNQYEEKLKKCYKNPEDSYEENSLKKNLSDCVFNTKSKRAIFATGNSYLQQSLPSLVMFSEQEDYRIHFYARGGSIISPYDRKSTSKDISTELTRDFFEYVEKNGSKGDIVFVSNPFKVFIDVYHKDPGKYGDVTRLNFYNDFKSFLIRKKRTLSEQGIHFFLISNNPILNRYVVPQNCQVNKYIISKQCRYPHLIDNKYLFQQQKLDSDMLLALGESYISYLNPMLEKMNNHQRPWTLFHDTSHISYDGDIAMLPIIKSAVTRVGMSK